MSFPNDPLHPAVIKTAAYCPDSLAPLRRLASLHQLRDRRSRARALQLTLSRLPRHAGATWEVRMCGGVECACACESERAWEALASRAMMREALMDDSSEMRRGVCTSRLGECVRECVYVCVCGHGCVASQVSDSNYEI